MLKGRKGGGDERRSKGRGRGGMVERGGKELSALVNESRIIACNKIFKLWIYAVFPSFFEDIRLE